MDLKSYAQEYELSVGHPNMANDNDKLGKAEKAPNLLRKNLEEAVICSGKGYKSFPIIFCET